MSASVTAHAFIDDDEPRDQHVLACNVWRNNRPCNCDAVQDAPLPPRRPTTAERLDRLQPCPEPWLQKG